MDWRSRSICIGTILRCLSLGASLAKRLEEGRRVNEREVGREV